MTKRTKRALVSSALALLLCFTMLLGTTYAWFTDSVTTVNNKIVAGNLDIELHSAKQPATGTALNWTMVDANTNIFETGTLWEPGHVEVAYLWAKNVGTLALEFDLAINIVNEVTSTSVLGNTLKLSNYLKAQLVELDAATAYANRTAAKAAVSAGYGLTEYTDSDVLEATEEKYYALIVYMPEEVGNEANYAKGAAVPTIDMGITLLATQTPFEKDSFGNDYDVNAENNFVHVATKDAFTTALNNGENVILTDDITSNAVMNVANAVITGDGNAVTVPTGTTAFRVTTPGEDVTLALSGLELAGNAAVNNTKGLSLFESENVDLTIANGSVSAGAYAVRFGTGITGTAKATITDTTLSGWAGFVTFAKTEATFDNVTFDCTSNLNGDSNGYCAVVLHDGADDSVLTFKNCTFDLTHTGNADYGFIGLKENVDNVTINLTDCTFLYNGVEVDFNNYFSDGNNNVIVNID